TPTPTTPTPTPTTPPDPATAPTPAPTPKGPKTVPRPEAPKPAIETVHVMITSTPSGADILRDKVVVGKTPFRVALQRTNRDVKLELRLSKYQTSTLVVHADGSAKPQHVKLLPVAHNQAVNPFDDD
ncbi:MAG TPA: PEGA domain-containing protein, partial [Kofleriaceae bacterium]|nr:PEGA domain-containing protein [Kofleriaceae bacterium]